MDDANDDIIICWSEAMLLVMLMLMSAGMPTAASVGVMAMVSVAVLLMSFIGMDMGMEGVAAGAPGGGMMPEDGAPAAPQRVLAKVRAAGKRVGQSKFSIIIHWGLGLGLGGMRDGVGCAPVWSSAEQLWAMAVRSATRTLPLAQMQATSVMGQPDCSIASRPACC